MWDSLSQLSQLYILGLDFVNVIDMICGLLWLMKIEAITEYKYDVRVMWCVWVAYDSQTC